MAISVLRGKSYIFYEGLSETSADWYVVGRVLIPIRVDKTLGWRDPGTNKPSFTHSLAYMCLPAVQPINPLNDTLLPWINASNDVSFIPMFGVEEVLESISTERTPTFIESAKFDEVYKIAEEYTYWKVEEIHQRPIRIDKTLHWTHIGTEEEPIYLVSDAGICYVAQQIAGNWVATSTVVTNVPMFLTTKVFEWRDLTFTGPQGSVGATGAIGPQGPIGPIGPGSTAGATGATGGGGGGGPIEFIGGVGFGGGGFGGGGGFVIP